MAAYTAVSELTQEHLRELLHYNEDTGVFTWRVRTSSRAKIGVVAGALTAKGYVRIQLGGPQYLAHRLVWLYVHGRWPPADLDHINGDRADNRIANLREATKTENQQNRVANAAKKSALPLGVVVSAIKGRYKAYIGHGGKQHYLGTFDTPELAHAEYLAAKAVHHPFQPVPRVQEAA